MESFIAGIRIAIVSTIICVVLYSGIIFLFAKSITPETAEGSIIKNSDGEAVGSRLIAQKFTRPGYFWPRPSAVDYNASGAGGSNKSPTNSDLTERAKNIVEEYGASTANPLPLELAAASGGGLDPHITLRAALYQIERVSTARGIPPQELETLIRRDAKPVVFTGGNEQLVNVLELNLALDALGRNLRR